MPQSDQSVTSQIDAICGVNRYCSSTVVRISSFDVRLKIGSLGRNRHPLESRPKDRLRDVQALKKQNGLRTFTSLASTSDGALWTGTQHGGKGEGLLRSALLSGNGNVLWIGTTDKGLYRLSDGMLDHLNVDNGLSGRRILSILEAFCVSDAMPFPSGKCHHCCRPRRNHQ
jgi:hypothetical protein